MASPKRLYVLKEKGTFWWSDISVPVKRLVPDNCVNGTLTITAEGLISLELDNQYLPSNHTNDPLVMDADGTNLGDRSILGILRDKNEKAYLANLWTGNDFKRFHANDCLIGKTTFPADLGKPKFSEIGIPLEGYENWLCLNRIKYQDDDPTRIEFTFEIPEEDVYKTAKGEINISYRPNWSCGDNLKLNPTAYLRYTPEEPISFKEANEKFRSISDLLIILTNSEYCPKRLLLTLVQNNETYKHYAARNTTSADAPELHRGPTNFGILQSYFGEIFIAWEAKIAAVGSGIYSYLATKRGIKLYIEDEFKNLVGGLEAFHRKTTPDPALSQKTQHRIDRVLEQLGGKDRRLAKRILRHVRLTELQLSERLFQLITTTRPTLDTDRVQKFAEQCQKDRNDLAHFAGQRHTNDNSLFYPRLSKASRALSYLYHALILDQIGVKTAVIDRWFETGFGSSWIQDALADVDLVDKLALKAKRDAEHEVSLAQARKIMATVSAKQHTKS